MKCRLCKKEKKLLRKSHIIPEFMYQELFDEKHKFFKLNPSNMTVQSRPSTGEYDSRILCAYCDNQRLGNDLEDYASKVLYGGRFSLKEMPKFVNYKLPSKQVYTHITNLDYSRFKLFLLSVLWRASISKREFFRNVELGIYENEVREMILNKNPKDTEDFGCLILTIRNDLDWANQVHIQPVRIKTTSGDIYKFVISGSLYLYYVPKFNDAYYMKQFLLNNNNEIKILHAPENQGEDLLKKFLYN